MISAKIVCDSLHPEPAFKSRLTTFVLTYPRFIHAEFMTHRVFSRNASSSRAIPVMKQIEMIERDPAIPLAFRKNQKGMQAGDILENNDEIVQLWLDARDECVSIAKRMAQMDVHKQYANRILEPWAHITVVVTATEWANFFALRIHTAAMPEICELAMQMYRCYQDSQPQQLHYVDWHVPFVTALEKESLQQLDTLRMSVARCARVSYMKHDGTPSTLEEDEALCLRLINNDPIHASPFEHQATPVPYNEFIGNLRGWRQYRKTFTNENVTTYTGGGVP